MNNIQDQEENSPFKVENQPSELPEGASVNISNRTVENQQYTLGPCFQCLAIIYYVCNAIILIYMIILSGQMWKFWPKITILLMTVYSLFVAFKCYFIQSSIQSRRVRNLRAALILILTQITLGIMKFIIIFLEFQKSWRESQQCQQKKSCIYLLYATFFGIFLLVLIMGIYILYPFILLRPIWKKYKYLKVKTS